MEIYFLKKLYVLENRLTSKGKKNKQRNLSYPNHPLTTTTPPYTAVKKCFMVAWMGEGQGRERGHSTKGRGRG